MKKTIFFLSLLILLASSRQIEACVGRKLFIGALNSASEHILSEMLSVLINERTGTTVIVKYYDSSSELYDAVKRNEIGIFVENTDRAKDIVGKEIQVSGEDAYDILKEEFRRRLNLVWLEPFSLTTADKDSHKSYYGPVITEDVLVNFPALPRLINKLSGVIDERNFSKMIKSYKSGEKPEKIARDFLKAKKLI